jgi:hypothetical protein
MRKQAKTFVAATALVAGILVATALHADDPGNAGDNGGMMMSPGMIGEDGMMPMTEQMSDMMDHCSRMMQGAEDGGLGVPNEQWRKKPPVTPDTDG